MKKESLSSQPEVVRALIFDPADSSFLIEVRGPDSEDDTLMPVLFGGTINDGEGVAEALVRELDEELLINDGKDKVQVLDTSTYQSKFRKWWSHYFLAILPPGAQVEIKDPEVYQLLRINIKTLLMLIEGEENDQGERVPYFAFGHGLVIPLLLEKLEQYRTQYLNSMAA